MPGGVQGYDRYAYVNNNPVNGTDPSGHYACGDGEVHNCAGGLSNPRAMTTDEGCGGKFAIICNGSPKHTLEHTEEPVEPIAVPPNVSGISVQILSLISSYITDFDYMSPIAWRKAITVGNAINPNPLADVAIGVVGQGLTDAFNPNLSTSQRVERVIIAAGESGITGLASDLIGAGIALGGGGPGGYAAGQVISSVIIDNVVWVNYNHTYFGAAGY